METHTTPTIPPDCFPLETLNIFQSLEGLRLEEVNYFLWLNRALEGEPPVRFIFYIELVFEENEVLLLTSGEDSEAIRIGQAAELVQTAARLRDLNGQVSIQRVQASNFILWQPLMGKKLESIGLSHNAQGFYLNDAMLLRFAQGSVLIRLGEGEGFYVENWQE